MSEGLVFMSEINSLFISESISLSKIYPMKNIFIVLASLFLTLNGFSQKKFLASGDIFGRRVFIKNNGQFDKILPNQTKTSYAYVNGD
jgi:hypothetical protein